ncbi:MAG: ATP-binding protein [Candidatus Vogelbacteria bacterium]|nr:ATP-binding protein [Candidatus Vogelbacteria bacterium]
MMIGNPDPSKYCYIMQGVPGSGKSTVAKQLAGNHGYRSAIHSTDEYFMENGVYRFDSTKLSENHRKNLEAFKKSLKELPEPPFYTAIVVCDNTNIKRKDRQPYIDAAVAEGYIVAIVTMPHPSPEVAAARNKHGVPVEVIKRMIANWEP